MFSSRTVLVLFIFALIAFVGSANGQTRCEDELSRMRSEMYNKQMQSYEESSDRMGRITLSCETSTSTGRGGGGGGGGGGRNSGSVTIIEISFGLFFAIWAAFGIWFIFAARQKAMNAAAITPYSGEVGANYGTDEKIAMGVTVTAGNVPHGDTNV